MTKFTESINTQFYKLIAFFLFIIGVFSINSTCELIFHQSNEPLSLKRFCKNETSK